MPMFATKTLITSVTKVVRTDTEQKFFEVFDGQQISQTTFVLDFGSKGANNGRSDRFALRCCQRTAEGKMEGEKRERWMRLCVEAADGQDSNRLLELISEIDRLLHEKDATQKCAARGKQVHYRSCREKGILAPQLPAVGRSVRLSLEQKVWTAACLKRQHKKFRHPNFDKGK